MQNVDFLFEYEVKNRELDSVCLLGAYLENKGYSVAYVNSWQSLETLPPKYDAKVMVISACYDDGTYNYFTSHAESFDKVVNLQWEQVLVNSETTGKKDSSWNYSGTALRTRHICWGAENQQYLMEKFHISPEYLRVCGYLPLDFYRSELKSLSIDRQTLFTENGLDPEKKTLLFISSFSLCGLPQSEEPKGESSEIAEIKACSYESQQEIVEWFVRLAKAHPELQIVYRPHPAETSNPKLLALAKEYPNFHVISRESIRNWIMACDVLCNWQSTSMIELFASGKQVHLLRPVAIPFLYEMPIFQEGHYRAIDNYADFEKSVLTPEAYAGFPIPQEDLLRFYDIQDTPVFQRIGDFLIKTLQDDSYHCPPAAHKLAEALSDMKKSEKAFQRKEAFRYHPAFRAFCRFGASILKGTAIGNKLSSIEQTTEYMVQKRLKNPTQFLDSKAEKEKHDRYYIEKAKQNGASQTEIRNKVDAYKAVIRQFC